jgi:aryl-alcohol dehydrogenase-like predicted oxidoreductase
MPEFCGGGYYMRSLTLPRVILGTRNLKDDTVSRETVVEALKCGINCFDTSPEYGNCQEVEKMLGDVLSRFKRESYNIMTKIPGGEPIAMSAGGVEYWIRNSLINLRVKRIDMMNFTEPTHRVPISETISSMTTARSRGSVGEIGIANLGPEQIGNAMRGQPIVCMQVCYNILYRNIEFPDSKGRITLNECTSRNLPLFPYMPLQDGLLSGKYNCVAEYGKDRKEKTNFFTKYTESTDEILSKLIQLSNTSKIPLSCTAVNWLLSKEYVKSVIVGCTTPKQVRQIASNVDKLTTEETDHITKISHRHSNPWAWQFQDIEASPFVPTMR